MTLDKFAFTFYDLDKSNTATEYICIDDSQYEKIEVDTSKIDDDKNRAGVQCPWRARLRRDCLRRRRRQPDERRQYFEGDHDVLRRRIELRCHARRHGFFRRQP